MSRLERAGQALLYDEENRYGERTYSGSRPYTAPNARNGAGRKQFEGYADHEGERGMVPVYSNSDKPARGQQGRRRPSSARTQQQQQQQQGRKMVTGPSKTKKPVQQHPWLEGNTGVRATSAGRSRPARDGSTRRRRPQGPMDRSAEETDSRPLNDAGNRIGRGRVAKQRKDQSQDDLMVPPEQRMSTVKDLIAKSKAVGDLDRVVELQIELMALTHLQYGAASIEMAHAYWSLSDTYLRKQLAQQALDHAHRSHKISSALDDDAAVKFQPTILLTLGMCYTLLQKYGDAEKWLQKALRSTEKLYGEDHPACVLVHMGFANLHQLHGNMDKALEHLLRAWEIKEEECHRDGGMEGENEELAEIYSELGKLYAKTEEDEQALDMYQRSLRIYTARLGDSALVTGRVAQKVATIASKLGRYDEAATSFQTAAEILEAHHGECHKKTVDVWRKLCLLLVKLKRFPEAQELLLRVVNAEKVLFGASSINLVETYKLLAMVYKVDGQRNDMLDTHELVLQIYRKRYGAKDPRTKDYAQQLASIQAETGGDGANNRLLTRSRLESGGDSESGSLLNASYGPGSVANSAPSSSVQQEAEEEVDAEEEEEEEEDEEEEEPEHVMLTNISQWLSAHAEESSAVFKPLDVDGTGSLEARVFLQAMVSLIRDHGLPLQQYELVGVLRRVNNGGQVQYSGLADMLMDLAEALKEEEEEGEEEGEEEFGVQQEGKVSSPEALEAKKTEVQSALSLELEAIKAQAQAAARQNASP